jgi:hypothetical protein
VEDVRIDSSKYENIWDYEQYMRLAQPAIAALHALGAASTVEPCVILSHEYMGMPTVLAAIMEGEKSNFRTVFYAHECATMRRIVEGHPGHDTMFYNVMRAAMAAGHYVRGRLWRSVRLLQARADQGHALLRQHLRSRRLHAEGNAFSRRGLFQRRSALAYNGVPHWKITVDDKMRSRNKLRAYVKALLKFEPDYIFTHVTRLVPSKGLWRDLACSNTSTKSCENAMKPRFCSV